MLYVNEFNLFLRDYGVYFAIGIAAIIAATLLAMLLLNRHRSRTQLQTEQRDQGLINALGGLENIKKAQARGSRLIVELVDYSLLRQVELAPLGITSFVLMSNKLTLVAGDISGQLAERLNANRP